MDRQFAILVAVKVVAVCVLITVGNLVADCIRSMPFHRYP